MTDSREIIEFIRDHPGRDQFLAELGYAADDFREMLKTHCVHAWHRQRKRKILERQDRPVLLVPKWSDGPDEVAGDYLVEAAGSISTSAPWEIIDEVKSDIWHVCIRCGAEYDGERISP